LRPVEQRILFDAETGERGDCLKCCVASLLELDYEDVPHFAAMGDRWWTEYASFLATHGWRLGSAWFSVREDDPARLDGWQQGYWFATVKSPRIVKDDGTPGLHYVVMREGEVAWDPHPQREDGHLGFVAGEYLVPLDPAAFMLRPAA
jgi:hypothetical protein